MKHTIFLKLAAVALLAAVVTTGCQTKGPKNVTPIPGSPTRVGAGTGGNALTNIATPSGPIENPGVGLPGPGLPGAGQGTTIPVRPIPGDTGIPSSIPVGPGGGAAADTREFDGMTMVREAFAANTIHFDYDKAIVKASEVSKLKAVIEALKASPQNKLLIEGHCDERGTESYNDSLGERRALAIRERLAKSGISADRLRTISYGENKPAELGHTEAAWDKNRRGELVLLKPKN